MIFSQCSVADAHVKMLRLEAEVRSLIVEANGKRVAVGLSAGLVAFSAQSGDHHVPMMQADAACYGGLGQGTTSTVTATVTDSNGGTASKSRIINCGY